MKKILISGVNGFLGSHLAHVFLNHGYRVFGLKRHTSNLTRLETIKDSITLIDVDLTGVKEALDTSEPDIIIHTICDYGRSKEGLSKLLETNLVFSVELLEHAVTMGVSTFINTDSALPSSVSPYALSKQQFKEWGRLFSNRIQFINMRIEHMYGVGDDENKFIYWFISQLKLSVEEIPLTSGIQLRDFVYIDDVVSAYLCVVEKIQAIGKYKTFDVASGELVPVKEFLKEIDQQFKKIFKENSSKLNFGVVSFRENEMMAANVSIKELKDIGWMPKTDIKNGISRIINELTKRSERILNFKK